MNARSAEHNIIHSINDVCRTFSVYSIDLDISAVGRRFLFRGTYIVTIGKCTSDRQ